MSNYVDLCKDIHPVNVTPATSSINWGKGLEWFAAVKAMVAVWKQRYLQRQLLPELTPHMLKDIGITEDQAEQEAAKPFWVE